MIRLRVPSVNNHKLLDDIIAKKHINERTKLRAVVDKIKARYEFYERNTSSLANIISDKKEWDDISDILLSCYGNNVSLNETKMTIKEGLPLSIQAKCPYCMLSRHNTFDHYFDKSEYPEYSVYIPNLIPCCGECNSLKGTKVLNNTGDREFIHFYYDDIPENQFLFIRFYLSTDHIPIINMHLEFPDDNQEVYRVIERHFTKLSLMGKYMNSINDKLSSLIEEIRDLIINFSFQQIKEILIIRHASISRNNGENYWEACMYEGVINSPNFLEALLVT